MNTLWTRSDCSLPSCLGQKRFHFSSSRRNQLRGVGGSVCGGGGEERRAGKGGGGGWGSQALINDRVRAVTQKARAEEQPRAAKLPPVRRRGEQQKPGLCGRVSAELRRVAPTNDGTVTKLHRELRFLSSGRLTRVTNLRKMLAHLSPRLTACHNLFYRKKRKKRIHNSYFKKGLILFGRLSLDGSIAADRLYKL